MKNADFEIIKHVMDGNKNWIYHTAEHNCGGIGLSWSKENDGRWKCVHFYTYCPDCGCLLPKSDEIEKKYLNTLIDNFYIENAIDDSNDNTANSKINDLLVMIKKSSLIKE